ncbi:hypothetical protein [Papillibacter cinnamivorans]|uniref:Uncharacterized protein n=1 Tax=Papillibacter cinnamivorans DSM 12816 TaxID=1122930 RepID=A0A1W2BHH5_9FIRM|nr:hypothetical protein [Papillibacter cinnamivorans]SMC72364.1 hypothetical protein SAMN02745168_2202 [Papillibacter cinnamivorans DSM 12816]
MDEKGRPLGIAYLYAMITAAFSIASCLMIFFYSAVDKYAVKAFLLQFCTFAAIWFIVYVRNRKQNQRFRTIFQDSTVRKAAGALIIITGLTGLSVYLPQIIYAFSSLVNRNSDLSTVPTIVTVILILFQIAVGLFLLRCKGSACGQYNAGTVLGIALFYTVLTAAYSLLTKLAQIIFLRNSYNQYFFWWIGCIAAIILVLYALNKKRHQGLSSVIHDDTARKSAGILMIINGIVDISVLVNSVVNIIWLLNSNITSTVYAVSSITLDMIKFIILACQIGLGAYLLKSKRKADEHNGVR